MTPVRILFDLRTGIGLGDSVQMVILFKHLRRYRPHWQIDVRTHPGLDSALRGHVNRVFRTDEPEPAGEYDAVQALHWTDCFDTFADRPSTKVAYALRWVFGIEQYDADLGRYEIMVDDFADETAAKFVANKMKGLVATHSAGNSHPREKNLPVQDAIAVNKFVTDCGYYPFMADRYCPRSAAHLAALIGHSKAFVGIDSGPGKVASATDTPTLICWTGHHPLRYHDPAPNTTHLIPEGWSLLLSPFAEMNEGDRELFSDTVDYFVDNYKYATYRPGELAQEACRWLREVLK